MDIAPVEAAAAAVAEGIAAGHLEDPEGAADIVLVAGVAGTD